MQSITRQVLSREFCKIALLNDYAARRWAVKPGDQIQDGRLARAGTAKKRDELAGSYFEVHSINRANHGLAHAIVPAKIYCANRGRPLVRRFQRHGDALADLPFQHTQSIAPFYI